MSHFFTLVLVDDDGRDIESQVEDLLAPYDENIEVAPYERECSCVGQVARNVAGAQAEDELGTIEELRVSFKEKHPEHTDSGYGDEAASIAWKAHIKPLQDRERELFEAHPDKDKPEPTCGFYVGRYWEGDVAEGKLDESLLGQRYEDGSGCGGTGTYISTYSPESQWDWWVIGGRWTGELDSEYDPYTDPQNIILCDLCNGTGDRPGWVVYEASWKDISAEHSDRKLAITLCEVKRAEQSPQAVAFEGEVEVKRLFKDDWAEECNGCNGCHGTGERVKWFLEPFGGDVMPVRELPENTVPFALVAPDGMWHERGNMGWWACVSNEKEKGSWGDEVKSLLAAHQDCLAVVCDLHI